MCAMIPMFRVRASGYSRMTRPFAPPVRLTVSRAACATFRSLAAVAITDSPSVVRERLVRVRHLVHVLAPLDRRALPVRRVHDLPHQPLGHGMLSPGPGVVHQPPKRQGGPPVRPDLDRDLIGGPAHPPGLHL